MGTRSTSLPITKVTEPLPPAACSIRDASVALRAGGTTRPTARSFGSLHLRDEIHELRFAHDDAHRLRLELASHCGERLLLGPGGADAGRDLQTVANLAVDLDHHRHRLDRGERGISC